MRRSVAVLVLAMLAAMGVFAPAASAAPAGPKVVIIVGATHGVTSSYRKRADAAYAEAIKYTSNVVRVYSPNATWSKVKAAAKGASIVVYMGHGNGWPSPYTYDPKYTTKDGFGLNATAGHGDSNNKYYGEPYVSTLDLAPNAVILLSHLCYASGNSEPGDKAPSQATARKRVSNYAAGFLKAARAVIADGHGGPEPYIRALFTTHATIEEVWRSAPNFHGHVSAFPSSRTAGATAYTDTDSATSGYYRSLVARPGLTTDMVTGATYADTGVDPTSLVVPGNGEVGADGAGLYGDAALTPDDSGQPPATVPAGTRLRTIAGGSVPTATGTAAVRVEGLDDASVVGWMSVVDVIPRDSRGPQVWAIDTIGGRFSPNGDGRFDQAHLTGRFSEVVDWRVRITGTGDAVLHEATGSGDDFDVTWDGLDGATPFPDGTYGYSILAEDDWDNAPVSKSGSIAIDTVPAELSAVTPDDGSTERWFAPNGDGSRDTVAWTATTAEAGSVVWRVLDGDGTEVRRATVAKVAGPAPVTWDGKDDDGHVVADGRYDVVFHPRDASGTQGDPVTRSVRVATTLGFVTTSKTLFYPQDADRFARTTTLGFRLARPATVTWTIVDASGATVATLLDAQPTAAGAWTRTYDGRRADGTRLKAGKYSALVTATDDLTSAGQAASFTMDAFSIKPSDTTPKRGQKITIKVTSAEPLSTRPRVYVKQPGKATWSVLMTKTSSYGYKATVTLKKGGSAGSLTFKVIAKDKDGRRQKTSKAYAIH